jgi:hypothetical protein
VLERVFHRNHGECVSYQLENIFNLEALFSEWERDEENISKKKNQVENTQQQKKS